MCWFIEFVYFPNSEMVLNSIHLLFYDLDEIWQKEKSGCGVHEASPWS